ncbi:MAG: histidine ammonia-lyase [Saprospiraceae bacterium]|nr:histidine ammonia-lyase [Bacteroidia bacterium]NNK90026.1 histidine ammonia-lyase [Saprospiraceae bacterium]
MSKITTISPHKIKLDELFIYFRDEFDIQLSEESIKAVQKTRSYLERRMAKSHEKIYGVNTGFGSLCDVEINREETEQLQYNLIVSHAAGVGEIVPVEIARLVLLLKIKNLSFGYSGVRLNLINKMIGLFNQKITPIIYQQGSLGASGDLAPLAHMSLPIIGKGEVWYEGNKHSTNDLFNKLGIEPFRLSSKEGLALINGTQFSLAYSIWSAYHTRNLMYWCNLITALSIEAYQCSLDPFDPDIQNIRQHNGQKVVAARLLELLEGSEVLKGHKHGVQDPYSFRCVPQVHGASFDAIEHVLNTFENELNAVTDNPNVFTEEDKILSGGNFHAQPLALSLDFLGIALAELANISERRTYKLIEGSRGLPDYLTAQSGLHSGMMITQYTAASVVSQNKQLCSPSSVDSIVSSKGQEDHVSMAANGATKTYRIVENVYKVLAIELMVACQALEFRRPLKSSPALSTIIDNYREHVPKLNEDRVLHDDIIKSIAFLKARNF